MISLLKFLKTNWEQARGSLITDLETIENVFNDRFGTPPLTGTKTYYVSTTSGGSPTHAITFTNGILTSEG